MEMSNDHFQIALRQWLGANPFDGNQDDVHCCVDHRGTAHTMTIGHIQRCAQKLRRIDRHDRIVKEVSAYLSEMHLRHDVEMRTGADNDRRRPDIVVHDWPGHGEVWLDVTCVLADDTSSDRLVGASRAEKEKLSRYSDLLKATNGSRPKKLLTLCYESGGAKGSQFLKFLKMCKSRLASCALPHQSGYVVAKAREWTRRLDLTYWRETASMLARMWSRGEGEPVGQHHRRYPRSSRH